MAFPQTGWQRLLSEFQSLLSAAAERVGTWWNALGSSVRGRAAPQVTVIDSSRFWEVDAWRGLAMGMLLLEHLIVSWLTVLSASLAGLAMALWTPVKVPLLAVPMLAMIAGAMILAPTFEYSPPAGRHARVGEWFGSNLLYVVLFGVLTAVVWWLVTTGPGGGVFIFLMGLSLTLSYHRARQNQLVERSLLARYLSRGAQLFGWGLALTVLSYLIVPQSPILFGILHLLGLSIILAYPFLGLPAWVSLAVGLPIIGLGAWLRAAPPAISGLWGLLLGISPAGLVMLDYWPLLPWFGAVLLGIAVGKVLYPEGQRGFELPDLSETRLVKGLSFLGRNSLAIYVLQMPGTLAGVAMLQG